MMSLNRRVIAEHEALLSLVGKHRLDVFGSPERWAIVSRCGHYRYALVTEVAPEGHGANGFCALNPSTASHGVDDNAHTKCMEFSRRWGFRYNWMLNAFAIRSTDPKIIKSVADPVGPANGDILHFVAGHLNQIVASWGKGAAHLARGARVKRELIAAGAKLHAFRFNKDGSPEHPLYMPYETMPEAWT